MESKEIEDIILKKLLSGVNAKIAAEVVTLKSLKLKEGLEDLLLYVLLHVMLCGPRGTGIELKLAGKDIIIRDLFNDFTHRGWLVFCVDAHKIFAPKLNEFKSISPYYRIHHKFWPAEIDVELEMKSRRDYFDKL
jgi:hypothetical protein